MKQSFIDIVSDSIIALYPSLILGGAHKEGGDGDTASPVLGGDASAVGPGLPPEADDYFKVCVLFRLCVVCVFVCLFCNYYFVCLCVSMRVLHVLVRTNTYSSMYISVIGWLCDCAFVFFMLMAFSASFSFLCVFVFSCFRVFCGFVFFYSTQTCS